MKKDLLSQYKSLINEIEELQKDIEKMEDFKVEHDKVTGSNPCFPYQPRSFTIEGYNIQDIDKANELRELLGKRKRECECLVIDIEKFISDIPDSRARRVFRYRYIDNLSWQAIAMRLGKIHESYPRRDIHDKYLDNL